LKVHSRQTNDDVENSMPAELPIACSLTATELPVRLAEMAALVDAHQDATHAELRFGAGAGVRERVEAIVAAESHCCAFVAMHVTGEPDAVVLTVDAPEGAELVLQELLDAFCGHPQAA
jgi:hypothetical protein